MIRKPRASVRHSRRAARSAPSSSADTRASGSSATSSTRPVEYQSLLVPGVPFDNVKQAGIVAQNHVFQQALDATLPRALESAGVTAGRATAAQGLLAFLPQQAVTAAAQQAATAAALQAATAAAQQAAAPAAARLLAVHDEAEGVRFCLARRVEAWHGACTHQRSTHFAPAPSMPHPLELPTPACPAQMPAGAREARLSFKQCALTAAAAAACRIASSRAMASSWPEAFQR
jgi:hypothetical protein